MSYRAAYTYEPIPDLMFYSMYATAYDPAAAAIFSVNAPDTAGPDQRAHLRDRRQAIAVGQQGGVDLAAYDIKRNNVYVQITDTTVDVAGEIASKGIELAAAVRPIEGWKLWGNVALTHARFENFDSVNGDWTGNTPV